MSEGPQNESAFTPEVEGFAAFTQIMDLLVPDEDSAPAAEGAAPAPTDDAANGRPPAAPETPGNAGRDALPAGTGVAGDPAVPAGGAGTTGTTDTGGAGSAAPVVSVSYADIAPKFGEMKVRLEESARETHQRAALEEVREQYGQYFVELQKHPRLLVGMEVPSMTGPGKETLRDSQDAKDWQEAAKETLADEIRARAQERQEQDNSVMQTLHSSIDLFQNNPDLVPGTKQFDRQLADEFVKLAKPYELRVEGKLHGYSIPVQPLVEQIRATVLASRAQAKAQNTAPPVTPAPPAAAQAAPAAPAAPVVEGPQAGISSRAGSSADPNDDFSTLFATIGLPNLRI